MSELRPPLWSDLKPEQLLSALVSPPDRYRPVPWLALTGDLDWPTVENALHEMRDKGITEFFLFAVYGMELPYLSSAFWSLAEQVLAFCHANSMKCWIYDDYNWPSGVCAGEVIRDYPEHREKHLCLRTGAGDTGSEPPPDAEALRKTGGVVWTVAPYARTMLTSKGCDWCNGVPGFLDMLSVEGNRRFIESTYDRYSARFPLMVPDVLPGFFTDEPAMHTGSGATRSGWLQLPYTTDLFESFHSRYGYDLRERLGDFLTDSETSRRTRCHYWLWVAERFGEAFGEQIRRWCDAQGVALTGHCLGEEPLVSNVFFTGDLWELMKHFTIPGIDMLRNADGYNGAPEFKEALSDWHSDPRGNHLTCKLGHAIARHSGAREMMCEAYGVSDWGMNLFRQKRGFNYLAALGTTLFNDNSLVTSIADFRKWAIAGKHFTQPWWAHYKQYADYNARVAAIHAEGEPVAEVAVLYPRSAIWAKCGANPSLGTLQTQLYELLDDLIRSQWHFDLLFEPVLAAARIEGQELVTEYARYKALVLPSATDLPQACIDVLAAFARSGGILLLGGDLPGREVDSQAGLGPQVEDILAASEAQHIGAEGKAVSLALEKAQLRRPLILSGEGARECISSWRRLASNDVLFVANMTGAPLEVEAELDLKRPYLVCEPDTLACYRPELKDGCHFQWHFEPWQAFLILCGKTAQTTAETLPSAPAWLAAETVEVMRDGWTLAVEPGNMLSFKLEARPDPHNRGVAEGWYRDPDEAGWTQTTDGRRLPEPILPGDAPWYWVRARVGCEDPTGPQYVVCDNPDFLEVYVNGKAADPVTRPPLWTEENVWFDARGLFRCGANAICVRAKTSKYNDPRIGPFASLAKLLQPVVLVGDFLVGEGSRLTSWSGAMQADQAWEAQGLPHFAGVGTCRNVFDWDGHGRLLLHLPSCTDAVEVLVNGKSCGVRTWPPYAFDLGEQAVPGVNQLVIQIRNTLGNIITETYMGVAPTKPPVSGFLEPPRLLRVG